MGTADKANNKVQDLKGRAKETAGRVTGRGHLENEGRADQAAAAVKDVGEKIKDAGSKAKDAVQDMVETGQDRAKGKRGHTVTSEAQFEVSESARPGVPVLSVRGEIDVASAPEFHASLSDVIGQGSKVVIVDTSGVTFIDSTGLGVLVGAEKLMREAGNDLRLVVTQPQITRLLELTGLDEVFTVMTSTTDAVTA